MTICKMLLTICAASGLASFGYMAPASAAESSAAKCDQATIEELLAGGQDASPKILACSATLPKNAVVNRSIIFEGSASSRATLDCNGATIDTSARRGRIEKTAIIVRSKQRRDGSWDTPQNVTVKNCVIKGFMRVYGLDENANGSNMKRSSMNPGHTEFAQASAPKRTTFQNLTIIAPGGAPLYVGPGVTWTTLSDSRLLGQTTGTAVYLDAESGRNSIVNNVFDIATKSRELIAIDGSTRNEISNNIFENPINGGIYLYRNCGEGGVIRHQTPDFNVISSNQFRYGRGDRPKPAIWLGSRGGKQKYCFTDPQHSFGSSRSPLDFAKKNTVERNRLINGDRSLIRNSDATNIIDANTVN